MRFKSRSNGKIYVEMIDSVTQELQQDNKSSMGLVSNQIENCIDIIQEEAHTLARNRAESADNVSHRSLQAMSDMENELCNLVFIMRVLLEQVRKTTQPEPAEDRNPPCFFVTEGESCTPPLSTPRTPISDSPQIQNALQLLQGSRERMNSLVLVDTNGILPNLVESQDSLQALEEENSAAENNSLRRPSLAFTNGSDSVDMSLNPQSSNDSLSVLRPRLPTIIDEFKDYNVQDMIDDRATLSRSSSRNVGIEIKMKGLGFSVFCSKGDHLQQEVKTVYNQSFPYKLFRFFQRKWIRIFNTGKDLETTTQLEERFILKDINLYLKPGKNYLILGPPSSGKTSLLKAIASLLSGQTFQSEHETTVNGNDHGGSSCSVLNDKKRSKWKGDTCIHGSISYDGFSGGYRKERDVRSSVIFVDQMDHHAPRLTVQETFDFAFQCKTGGTHSPQIRWRRALMNPRSSMVKTFQGFFRNMDKHNTFINILLEGLDLHHVKNTFVGDATNVRGVSGGQRRRVSIGEMLSTSISSSTAIFCGDEISTGLDAASSYDIVYRLCRMGSALKRTNILSLLQPSPETLKCFDEIILLSKGHLIFTGPAQDAVQWFTSLGYHRPPSIDVADFLLLVASHYDGVEGLFGPTTVLVPETNSLNGDSIPYLQNYDTSSKTIYDSETLAELFKRQSRHSSFHDLPDVSSSDNKRQQQQQDVETGVVAKRPTSKGDLIKTRYRNSFFRFVKLNTVRSFTIWIRDKRFVRVNIIKNIIMGISVGAVFFQTDAIDGIFGVLFQGMLFIMLGSMTAAPEQLVDRAIFYKHQDADFYPTMPYVLGRSIAMIPQTILDCVLFGTLLYWMVGLVASAEAFVIFLVIIILFSLTMNQTLSIFSSFAPTKSVVLALSSLILIFLMLFSGFIVSPDVIPDYFVWIYWLNPLAWAYRALLVNEFQRGKYGSLAPGHGNYTKGEIILLTNGFDLGGGRPFNKEWIGYTVIYLIAFYILALLLCTLCLQKVRAFPDQTPAASESLSAKVEVKGKDQSDIELDCNPVHMTFQGICYDVKSSKGSQTLRLLHDVSGHFRGGRMCALMGASGAGKTTLMDVIALRKTHGIISGEVRLNGVLQDKKTFPRYSGYVEQFDVQSAELTVHETVLFSAQLRLDSSHPASESPESRKAFVDKVIGILELESYSNRLVGSLEENYGLSFEQRKRLSIAVELAASPSILFLDEPTSGLDSRAAMIVVRALQKIARTGRTVCCTIHQPSSVIFEMFDDLLLLKKGEVVYFGELGLHSCQLIQYFESLGAPPMTPGENPSTWMLNTISKANDNESPDFIQCYRTSTAYESLHNLLQALNNIEVDDTVLPLFSHKHARSLRERNLLMARRLGLIYWRSPSYNYSRMLLCIFMGILLSSVFFANARPASFTETAIKSIISTIFISFIIVGVLSITTVMPVMVKIRDVFYRHRAAGMLDHNSLFWALAYAEMKFIIYASFLFCICFYFGVGFEIGPLRFASFWAFFTFNLAIYSYFGQAFTCCFRGMGTAQILAAVFIGLNNLFSGLIVRPQYLSGFWQAPFWITPGHYVFEGLVVTQFNYDHRPVIATEGSVFYQYLMEQGQGSCNPSTNSSSSSLQQCVGTVSEYVQSFFGGRFRHSHIYYDAMILGIYLVLGRLLTYIALRKFNFMAT